MKFIFLHNWNPQFSDRVGGVETFLSDLIKYISQTNEVEIISPAKIVFLNRFHRTVNHKKVRKRIFPDTFRFAIYLVLSLKFWKNRRNILVLQRPELVYILRKIIPRAKIVLFLHTDQRANSESLSDSIWSRFPRIYSRYIPLCYKGANFIFTFSVNSMEMIEKYNPNCTHLMASASEIFIPEIEQFRSGIVWVGRLEKPKNPLLAVEVLNKCVKNGLKVSMFGEGSMKPWVQELIQENFELQDFVNQLKLASVLHSSKYLIMTSNFEGSPRILVEGLLSGCFIVLNANSDPDRLAEIYPERIRITRNSTPEAFIEEIEKFEQSDYKVEKLTEVRREYLLNSTRLRNLVATLTKLDF